MASHTVVAPHVAATHHAAMTSHMHSMHSNTHGFHLHGPNGPQPSPIHWPKPHPHPQPVPHPHPVAHMGTIPSGTGWPDITSVPPGVPPHPIPPGPPQAITGQHWYPCPPNPPPFPQPMPPCPQPQPIPHY